MIWPVLVKGPIGPSRGRGDDGSRRWGGQAQEQRDAQVVLATMDHADIRGLVTAFHLSVVGLPAL